MTHVAACLFGAVVDDKLLQLHLHRVGQLRRHKRVAGGGGDADHVGLLVHAAIDAARDAFHNLRLSLVELEGIDFIALARVERFRLLNEVFCPIVKPFPPRHGLHLCDIFHKWPFEIAVLGFHLYVEERHDEVSAFHEVGVELGYDGIAGRHVAEFHTEARGDAAQAAADVGRGRFRREFYCGGVVARQAHQEQVGAEARGNDGQDKLLLVLPHYFGDDVEAYLVFKERGYGRFLFVHGIIFFE